MKITIVSQESPSFKFRERCNRETNPYGGKKSGKMGSGKMFVKLKEEYRRKLTVTRKTKSIST